MKNNILFISTLCSPKVFDYILNTSTINPGASVQKFHSLLSSGLALQESNIVETLSALPIISSSNKKRFWKLKSEYINNVKYNYILIINFPVIRNVIIFLHAFLKILFWKINSDDTNRIVICDILKGSIVSGAYFGCKLRGIKMIGIVTDIPCLDVAKVTFKYKMATSLTRWFLTKYDGYVLLTIQMNSIANPKLKPKIVMEGLVDINMGTDKNQVNLKDSERIILYSGGIYEQYGIKTLIKAFMKLDNQNIRLDIYGSGPMEKDMPEYMVQDKRIRYFGVVANEIIVDKQIKATLLVNPRPSNEEYTKYSFPSKNMEYMASGTPIVTTLLPGMPDEYLPYVYLFNDESTEGISYTLSFLLNKNSSELQDFGAKAKKFVLTHKNNFEQGRKITNLINKVLLS